MKRIDEKDRLPGGVDAKDLKKYLKRFDPKEVKMGREHEREHTKDPAIAAEIASDHLHDEPHYYSKLKAAKIESTDVFEFNFHDILEIIWDDPDEPKAPPVPSPEEKPKPLAKPANPKKYNSIFLHAHPSVSRETRRKRDAMAWSWHKSFYENLLEWDDDVPLGALVQKVKEPTKETKPLSINQANKQKAAANKIKRAELHAQKKHLLRVDLLKSGKAEHEVRASLDAFDREAPKRANGPVAKDVVPKTRHTHTRAFTFTPLTSGPELKAEKQKVVPSSYLPPQKGDMATTPEPVVEPTKAKNAVDNAFKSKKTDPRYSSTAKS